MRLVAKRVAQSSLFQSLRSSSRKLGRSRSSGGKGSSNESENGFVRVHEMVPGEQWRDGGESGKGSSRRTEESPDRAVPDGW